MAEVNTDSNSGINYLIEMMQTLSSMMGEQTDVFNLLAQLTNGVSAGQNIFNKGSDGGMVTPTDAKNFIDGLSAMVAQAGAAVQAGTMSQADYDTICNQVNTIMANIPGASTAAQTGDYQTVANSIMNIWNDQSTDPDAQKEMQNINSAFTSLSSLFTSINSIAQATYQTDSTYMSSYEGAMTNYSNMWTGIVSTINNNMKAAS